MSARQAGGGLPVTDSWRHATGDERCLAVSEHVGKTRAAAARHPDHSGGKAGPERVRYHYSFTSRPESRGFATTTTTSSTTITSSTTRPAARMRKARRAATSGGGSGKELLVFTVFLVVVMITLSQVLVVHHKYNVRYGQGAKPRSIRLKAQQELRQVERRIAALRHQNIPSLQQAAESLQKHVFISRIASLIQRATHESRHLMQHRLQPSNSSNHSSSSTWSSSPVSASQSLLLSALDYDLQETDIDASASLSEWNVSAASWGDNDNVTDDELEGGPANITTPSPVQLLCPEEPPLLCELMVGEVSEDNVLFISHRAARRLTTVTY